MAIKKQKIDAAKASKLTVKAKAPTTVAGVSIRKKAEPKVRLEVKKHKIAPTMTSGINVLEPKSVVVDIDTLRKLLAAPYEVTGTTTITSLNMPADSSAVYGFASKYSGDGGGSSVNASHTSNANAFLGNQMKQPSTQVKPVSSLESAFQSLDIASNEAEDILKSLEIRLESIMTSDYPEEDAKEGRVQDSSPLIANIDDFTVRTRARNDRLRKLISRLPT